MTTKVPVELSSTPGIVDGSNATAITIDSSENVGIGITSSLEKFTVSNSSSGIVGRFTNNTNQTLDLGITAGSGSAGGVYYNNANSGYHAFQVGGTEKMRIDSSGNVGIGNTSPSSYSSAARNLVIGSGSGTNGITITSSTNDSSSIFFADGTSSGAQYDCLIQAYHADSALLFGTGSTGAEDMRINSNGNVLVGTTNESQVAGAGVKLVQGTNGRVFVVGASHTSGESFSHYANGSYRFYVSYSGAIASTSDSITTISDERLKENIKDLDQGLADVLKLKPRKYDWKEGEGTGEKNVSGFVAQEAETAGFGEFVGDWKHDTLSDAKSFAQGGLIPVLVKAIQEQQTIIDDLKTRIKTLEDA